MIRDWPAILAIVFALLSGLVTASMRFSALETRVTGIESVTHELNSIDDRLSRIEGRLEEWKR